MNLFFDFMKCTIVFLVLIGCTTTLKNDSSEKTNLFDDKLSSFKSSSEEPSVKNAQGSLSGFPIIRNSDVEKWITYFQTTGRRTLVQWMQQGEPFRTAIEEVLENEGVPRAFYYLALIESGFVHRAVSTAKASGPWQFLKDTGTQYGLQSDDWIDQRRDPVSSTHAAAAYLRDLRAKFGDWYLTVAAYNGGPKTIQDAVKKAGTKDFWQLKKSGILKKETVEFVPKMIAVAIIGNNPAQFGFPEKVASQHSEFPKSTIKIKRPVKIQDLAKKLAISVAKLKMWNPELLKDRTPPKRFNKDGHYALRVPEEHVEKFEKIESQLETFTFKDIHYYKIARGDTLDKLAKRYHVSVKTLLQMNPQLHARKIAIGTKIAMPVSETPS